LQAKLKTTRSRTKFDLANLRKTAPPVACLLPETSRKSAENSGKRGTQLIEANDINVLEKTLNQ